MAICLFLSSQQDRFSPRNLFFRRQCPTAFCIHLPPNSYNNNILIGSFVKEDISLCRFLFPSFQRHIFIFWLEKC